VEEITDYVLRQRLVTALVATTIVVAAIIAFVWILEPSENQHSKLFHQFEPQPGQVDASWSIYLPAGNVKITWSGTDRLITFTIYCNDANGCNNYSTWSTQAPNGSYTLVSTGSNYQLVSYQPLDVTVTW
jgi:hypothetical protein